MLYLKKRNKIDRSQRLTSFFLSGFPPLKYNLKQKHFIEKKLVKRNIQVLYYATQKTFFSFSLFLMSFEILADKLRERRIFLGQLSVRAHLFDLAFLQIHNSIALMQKRQIVGRKHSSLRSIINEGKYYLKYGY